METGFLEEAGFAEASKETESTAQAAAPLSGSSPPGPALAELGVQVAGMGPCPDPRAQETQVHPSGVFST